MKLPSPRNWWLIAVVLIVFGILALSLSGYFTPLTGMTMGPLVSIQQWVSSRYMAIYQFFTIPRDVESLMQQNAVLEDDVARLQTEIVQLEQQLAEAEVLYALLDFARINPENQYIAAAVIGRDPSPYLQYVFIDHGSDDGLRHGMPIVNEDGLIGRIDAVTATAARVQLISDVGFAADVLVQPSEIEAVLVGSLTGELFLDMISQDVIINTGDLVMTSGLGGGYPPDVLIGQVVTVRSEDNGLFQTASVQPAADFTSMQAVLVIVNFRPVDISPLIPTPAP